MSKLSVANKAKTRIADVTPITQSLHAPVTHDVIYKIWYDIESSLGRISEMSDETLESVVRGFAEAFTQGDVQRTLSFLTEDAVWETPEGTFKGKEEIKRFVTWAAQTSPQKKFRDAGIGIIVSGNKAVHEHILEAATPQNMRFETPAMCVYEFIGEKIQKHRALYDRLSVGEQVATGWIEKQVFRSILNSWEKGLH